MTESGSAKGRRSIASRPKGAYGRLRAMRPGEYTILDTQGAARPAPSRQGRAAHLIRKLTPEYG
jgi:hypothetical protein